MRYPDNPLASNGQFARGLLALGAYVFGWVIAFAASALTALLMNVAVPDPRRGTEQELLPSWLLTGAGWTVVAALGAYLLTVMGRRHAVALGLVAALGGLSALFVPLLVYGFPLPVYVELWFEALMLGVCLPTAVFALSRLCRI
jgi:hypothetical protein